MIFNEDKLQAEIIKTWGEFGVHNEVFQAMRKKISDKEQLTLTDVSFSIFDKVYMDSPFGRYTGVVKGVEESKVIIESHSPNGKGMMLADYDLTNNDWQKY